MTVHSFVRADADPVGSRLQCVETDPWIVSAPPPRTKGVFPIDTAAAEWSARAFQLAMIERATSDARGIRSSTRDCAIPSIARRDQPCTNDQMANARVSDSGSYGPP
jgi:hypothetical protein